MLKHNLVIMSLYDAVAECSCGMWKYVYTGKRTKKQLNQEHKKHIRKTLKDEK